MDSGGVEGRAVMSEKETKNKEKQTVGSSSPPSASPVEPFQEAAGSTLAHEQAAAKRSRVHSAEAASSVELVHETAPTASTLVNQQGDLAMHLAERSRVNLAVADPPSAIADVSTACMMSVVTVATITAPGKAAIYCTGFILLSENNYCVIFSSLPTEGSVTDNLKYKIYFEGGRDKVEAHVLCSELKHKFVILFAKTDKKYPAVSFRNDPPGNEMVVTIGSMSGTRLHEKAQTIMNELIGHLGIYKGEVITPNCDAVDLQDVLENGSNMYFEVTCNVQDHIVTLQTIDQSRREFKSHIVRSAPVFSMTNEVIGLIYSSGTWNDVKVGLHSKYIIILIKKMCKNEDWEAVLKKAAENLINDE